jgi:hypothetical protein
VAQIGIAGAVVVERNFQAGCAQPVQDIDGDIQIVDNAALGDFYFE